MAAHEPVYSRITGGLHFHELVEDECVEDAESDHDVCLEVDRRSEFPGKEPDEYRRDIHGKDRHRRA